MQSGKGLQPVGVGGAIATFHSKGLQGMSILLHVNLFHVVGQSFLFDYSTVPI
jgi:hypothetical protein